MPLRWILILLAAIWLSPACSTADGVQQTTESPRVAQSAQDPWRRTKLGWQRRSEWRLTVDATPPPPATGIHPSIIALLQFLIASGALLAGTRDRLEFGQGDRPNQGMQQA
jgi:hypothetical protein